MGSEELDDGAAHEEAEVGPASTDEGDHPSPGSDRLTACVRTCVCIGTYMRARACACMRGGMREFCRSCSLYAWEPIATLRLAPVADQYVDQYVRPAHDCIRSVRESSRRGCLLDRRSYAGVPHDTAAASLAVAVSYVV